MSQGEQAEHDSGVPELRRPARRVVLAVAALAAVLVATATAFVVINGIPGTRTESVREGWPGFEAERVEMIRELAAPVLACVGRVDERARESAMFHGCGDWHNALAGHYALYTAYRRTGDVTYLRAAEQQIHADKVPAELQFLPQLVRPHNWRRHYGFPWLLAMLEQRDAALAMARQRGEVAGNVADLSPIAAEAVSWLRDWLTGLEPGRARGYALADQYVNLSWAVLNLIRWARHTNDAGLLALARTVVDDYLRVPALDRDCPVSRDATADATQFIPPCLMRAAAVAELDGADAKPWVEKRIPADFSVPPLTDPQTAEAAGLNFHRAAALGVLYRVTGRDDLRDNYATLIRHHVAHPHQWRDDYRRHSQWIPQFGIHAIEESYGWAGG